MSDVLEFTDDELEYISDVITTRINKINLNAFVEFPELIQYLEYEKREANGILSKIETIRESRQGEADIDDNIASELE